MARYLSEHPDIFVSDPKEPHFFNTDFANRHTRYIKTYESYFRSASEYHMAVGEASVFYLFSHEAVPNILNYQAKAQFVVMLRNPVDMVYSWHSEALQSFGETEADFEKAWRLSATRRKGKQIPSECVEGKVLDYKQLCMLGEQLERLYGLVEGNRVLVLFFDDLMHDAKAVYKEALSFLGVSDDHRSEFPVYNANRQYRFHFLRRVLCAGFRLKSKLGVAQGIGLMSALKKYNIQQKKRPQLPYQLKKELLSCFKEDINRIESLTGKDLVHWKWL